MLGQPPNIRHTITHANTIPLPDLRVMVTVHFCLSSTDNQNSGTAVSQIFFFFLFVGAPENPTLAWKARNQWSGQSSTCHVVCVALREALQFSFGRIHRDVVPRECARKTSLFGDCIDSICFFGQA
eukprot:m.334317 g.334317  ORF g.334317 m.334317 type:complete len:126 (-) comp16070_c1_seq2:672-1049(-)